MGYYTKFRLIASNDHSDCKQARDLAQAALITMESAGVEIGYGYDFLKDLLDDDNDAKWYEHEQNMREWSARAPDVLFTLEGEGEEAGDVWKKYFKDGKMQICRAVLTFEPYDPAKLK
jgi:hypothetical protein